MKRIGHILIFLVILCSCDRRDSMSFSSDATVRLEVGGKTCFSFDPLTCQISYNSSTGIFRTMTDNASDYFTVAFKSIPKAVGDKLYADISWTTDSDIINRKDVALEVIRLEGDKVWLWSQSGQIALVVRLLV